MANLNIKVRKSRSQEDKQKALDTRKATQKRRAAKTRKVFELKIDASQTSKIKLKELDFLFIQVKWIWNYVLASKIDVFKYKYNEHKVITHKDKEGNDVSFTVTLAAILHEGILTQMRWAVKALAALKSKGHKVGGLKFKGSKNPVTCVYNKCPILILSKRKIKIPGIGKFNVNGLKQLNNLNGLELCDTRLIRKASGFYVKIGVCFDPIPRVTNGKTIGVDFNKSCLVTTSEGDKYDVQFEESERTKALQRKLARQKPGSSGYAQTLNKLRQSYEDTSNKRKDAANKVVHELLENDRVAYQNDDFSKWSHKGTGRRQQHGALGRTKSLLAQSPRTMAVGRFRITTRKCSCCGAVVPKGIMSTSDRIFFCPTDDWVSDPCPNVTGIDRDVNAAINIRKIAYGI